jgi:hypothetical protein
MIPGNAAGSADHHDHHSRAREPPRLPPVAGSLQQQLAIICVGRFLGETIL